jgi:hypothetical protein
MSRNSRDLLQLLEHVFSSPNTADLAALQHALQAAKPDFINLLRYKVQRSCEVQRPFVPRRDAHGPLVCFPAGTQRRVSLPSTV